MQERISQWVSGLSMGGLLAMLAVIFALTIGTYVLQAYLSGRASKWPGLVLPALFFLDVLARTLAAWRGVLPFLWELLWRNLGTGLLLLIYYVRREKLRKKKSEMEKMNIQDLD